MALDHHQTSELTKAARTFWEADCGSGTRSVILHALQIKYRSSTRYLDENFIFSNLVPYNTLMTLASNQHPLTSPPRSQGPLLKMAAAPFRTSSPSQPNSASLSESSLSAKSSLASTGTQASRMSSAIACAQKPPSIAAYTASESGNVKSICANKPCIHDAGWIVLWSHGFIRSCRSRYFQKGYPILLAR